MDNWICEQRKTKPVEWFSLFKTLSKGMGISAPMYAGLAYLLFPIVIDERKMNRSTKVVKNTLTTLLPFTIVVDERK